MTDRAMSCLSRWLMSFFLLGFAGLSNASTQNQCERSGVVFGFFNGVQTQEDDAQRALHQHIEILYGPTTPAGEPITYELFYNDTQGFADFVETFEQRLQEQNGVLAERFELFFSSTQGAGTWWDQLTTAIPAFNDLRRSLVETFLAKLVRGLTTQLGEPNMAEVSARHQAQIDHWASLNQKMLFLAHSQGNLFVNKAYAHAVGKSGAEYVRAVHVAPASPGLSGRHTLADKDLVINGLRLTGAVAPNTDEIAPYLQRPPGLNGSRDLIGHGLLEIYLNPALSTAGRIRDHVLTALHELDAAPRKSMPPYPDFVYRDWPGGDAPAAVYARNEASHQLQKIVQKETVAVPWMFSSSAGWRNVRNLDTSSQPGITKRSTHYVGEGMNGYEECAMGVPLEGWSEPQPTIECIYEKVPVKARQLDGHLHVPDELKALGSVPEGTIVYLNEMTYSLTNDSENVFYRPDTEKLVMNVDTPGASIGFYSAFLSRWSNTLEDQRVWNEPYWIRYGQVLNLEAILARNEAFRKHEEAEYLRSQQHALQRWAYEQKRLACGSAI